MIVMDCGQPRNCAAAHMHAYLGYDGAPPAALVEAGRAEVRRYGGEVLRAYVSAVRGKRGEFVVSAGHVKVRARRVIAATGVWDVIPDVEALCEHWGKSVIHCPLCHGYEARGLRMVQLVTHPLGLHSARLFAHLNKELTLVIDPTVEYDRDLVAGLQAGGATVATGTALRVLQTGDRLTGVELTDGRTLICDVVAVTPRVHPRIDAFVELGVDAKLHTTGICQVVQTSPTGETSVAGLYAAGNVTDRSHQIISAAADGSRIGAMVALDLAADEQRASSPPPSEWDERYSRDELASGRPNGALGDESKACHQGERSTSALARAAMHTGWPRKDGRSPLPTSLGRGLSVWQTRRRNLAQTSTALSPTRTTPIPMSMEPSTWSRCSTPPSLERLMVEARRTSLRRSHQAERCSWLRMRPPTPMRPPLIQGPGILNRSSASTTLALP